VGQYLAEKHSQFHRLAWLERNMSEEAIQAKERYRKEKRRQRKD
jgi:hypothetical protein